MIRLLEPWWLLTLLGVAVVAAAYVVVQASRRRYAVRFTNVALLRSIAPRGLGWRRHLAAGCFLAATALLALALARPAVDRDEPLERATVVLAIDVSLSMKATDVEPNRFAAAREAAKLFVAELPDRYNVVLVAFAGNAQVVVPATKEHQLISGAIDRLQLRESTAIGEAIFVSLDAIGAVPADGEGSPPPARIVLLSDGFTTAGRPNDEAATAAASASVPVTTIAFGTSEGTVEVEGVSVPVPVDGPALDRVAQQTSGRFYSAVTAAELRDVYRDLGSSIGHRTKAHEVTRWFVAAALLLALIAASFTVLWTPRLP